MQEYQPTHRLTTCAAISVVAVLLSGCSESAQVVPNTANSKVAKTTESQSQWVKRAEDKLHRSLQAARAFTGTRLSWDTPPPTYDSIQFAPSQAVVEVTVQQVALPGAKPAPRRVRRVATIAVPSARKGRVLEPVMPIATPAVLIPKAVRDDFSEAADLRLLLNPTNRNLSISTMTFRLTTSLPALWAEQESSHNNSTGLAGELARDRPRSHDLLEEFASRRSSPPLLTTNRNGNARDLEASPRQHGTLHTTRPAWPVSWHAIARDRMTSSKNSLRGGPHHLTYTKQPIRPPETT